MFPEGRKPVKVQTEVLKGVYMNTENNYIETDLGNVSPSPCGEYDPSAQYEYLDLVSYQGGSYLCLIELGTKVSGTAPEAGKNTDTWQLVTLPGNLTPEYVAMHDDVANKAKQVESSRAAVEQSQQNVEAAQTDVQQLHSDTTEAAQEASDSRDSAAGYASAAEQSRKATKESEENVTAQVTGFDSHVTEKTLEAVQSVESARQTAVDTVIAQQNKSVQEVKYQTASYITEKETSAKTKIGNYTSEKVAEINNKASEANITLANTIADGTSLKTQLETTISTADTSKKNLDASDTAAGKTKTALDISNTTATKTKADLDASNTTASEAKTELDATNKTAADLVVSLRDKITEGTRVKTDIQTTGETAMSNLQAEATKQQEYIKTSIDDTLSISGKAADAAVTGKKMDSLKEDIGNKAPAIIKKASGKTIIINDSSNLPIKILSGTGKIIITGKNILDIKKGAEFTLFEAKAGTLFTLITNGELSEGGNIKLIGENNEDVWFAIDKGKTKVSAKIDANVKGYVNLLAPKEGLKYCFSVGENDEYEEYVEQVITAPVDSEQLKVIHTNYPTTILTSENKISVEYVADTEAYIEKRIKEENQSLQKQILEIQNALISQKI